MTANNANTNHLQKHVERIFASPASSSQVALGNYNTSILLQDSRLEMYSTFPVNYRLSGIISAMLCYYLQAILDAVRDARNIPVPNCTNRKNDNNNNHDELKQQANTEEKTQEQTLKI